MTKADITEARRLVAADPGLIWALVRELLTWRAA